MDPLLQDIRFGWRMLRRTPGFTIAAVVALALGVGATTAIFTVLDRVVLRPLPYPDPDRLAMVWDTNDGKGLVHERISPVTFGDYRGLTQVSQDAAGWWYPQVNLTEAGRDPMRVNAVEASGNLFAVVGVQPVLGAGFPADPFYSRDRIAVISHRLWRERFAGDAGIIGRPITLSDAVYTVAGVMPAGFQFPNETDVWQRLQWDFSQHSRGAHFVESLFRLKPGMTLDQANNELRGASLRAAPGVTAAGLANFLPLDAAWRLPFLVDGRPRPTEAPQAQNQSVDEDYFKVIGVPLLKGRFFEARDSSDAPGVVLINEALAKREWPNEDPICQHITTFVRNIGPMGTVLMPAGTKYQIVGVVANVRNASLAQPPEPAIFFTYRQFSFRGFNIVVKGQGDVAAIASAVRASVQRLDPNLPLSQTRTLDRVIGDATDRPRALML